MTFNDAVCNIKDIKTKCCKSCSSDCRDDAVCPEYPDIEILCKLSLIYLQEENKCFYWGNACFKKKLSISVQGRI